MSYRTITRRRHKTVNCNPISSPWKFWKRIHFLTFPLCSACKTVPFVSSSSTPAKSITAAYLAGASKLVKLVGSRYGRCNLNTSRHLRIIFQLYCRDASTSYRSSSCTCFYSLHIHTNFYLAKLFIMNHILRCQEVSL